MFSSEMNDQKKAVILNSRQPVGSSGSCRWVTRTIEAVQWIKQQGYVLVTSVGMQTWEIVLLLAVKYSIPRIVLIPCSTKGSFFSLCMYYSEQFNLDDNTTEYLKIGTDDGTIGLEAARDQCAVQLSNVIIPVALRKNGSMIQLLSMIEESRLQRQFLTQYQSRSAPLHFDCTDAGRVNDELTSVASEYIFHWTRTTYKPWPDERLSDYYSDIINSKRYPRTAMKTLEHIVDTGVIIGSSRHMPDNERCVSFTGKRPDEFIPLMRWRSRYHEMSYEPYGIGIRNCAAFARNVKKVLYTDQGCSKKNALTDRWLIQSVGKKGRWDVEDEYRYKGNFIISGIERSDLLIVCSAPDLAAEFSDKFGIKVLPMFKTL